MVVFRQRRVFVCVSGLILGIALLYAFTGTRYQAHMKIMVRRGRADAVATPRENAPVDLARMAITEEDLNSEVELLKDDEILRRVVEANKLTGRDWFHFLRPGEGRAAAIERATRRLAGKLRVETVKKTNLIAVSYESADPALAARVLHLLATLYLEKHMEVHRPVGEFQFFEQQTDESKRQLEEANQKLLQFASSHGVVAAAQQRDQALQKLSDVDANYRQAQVERAETERRIQELKQQMATQQERTTTQVRIADNPELLKALKSSLLELQLKRTQLLTKFEPNHRLVQELDQQIAQAKGAIATEMLAPLRDETTDKNPNYEWAKSQLQQAEVQLKGLEAKTAATGTQASAYRSLARQLGEDAFTQDSLLSAERAALDTYLLYVKKREEARVDDALDQRGIVNVAIAEQPVAPALPVWSAWTLLAIGFVVAGASGTTAAFAADYLDPAFRTPDEVLACLNAPVLASLPKKERKLLSA
jgi:succinoglycan biosynthesis transport protein ExoP